MRGVADLLLGQYEHTIDQKGRLAIPARFRARFRQGLVLTRGYERCITVYPIDEWQRLATMLASRPQTRSVNRRLSRFVFANAFPTELDGQGRVLLPQPLREFAEIGETVIVAGLMTHLEVWSRHRWDAERVQMDEQAWQLAEDLEPAPGEGEPNRDGPAE